MNQPNLDFMQKIDVIKNKSSITNLSLLDELKPFFTEQLQEPPFVKIYKNNIYIIVLLDNAITSDHIKIEQITKDESKQLDCLIKILEKDIRKTGQLSIRQIMLTLDEKDPFKDVSQVFVEIEYNCNKDLSNVGEPKRGTIVVPPKKISQCF
jgi:transcriptional regulator of heat shock response